MMHMSKPRSDQVFDHAQKFAAPFRTTLGQTWAIVPDGPGRYRGYPVSSHSFRQWLAQSFHTAHSIYPNTSALESAVRMFEAHAHHLDFPASDVFTRVGWRGDRRLPQAILLHLANTNNELVEITPNGHRIVSADSCRFVTGPGTLPLPRPIDNTVTLRDHLRPLLNLDGPALERTIVWLFAALRPSAPYPALVISGPSASGKSMLARMLRYLIDPSAIPFLIPPATEHDLFTLALHNHILAFDRAGSLRRPILDSLARVAAGAGLGRPIIVTVPSNQRAAIDNAIRIDLAPIDPAKACTEANLAQKYLVAAPAILGTLCAAVTAALSNTTATAAAPVSPFAAVHQWTMAAAPSLGLTTEQISRALAANSLIDALSVLLQTQPDWTGTATELLNSLKTLGFSAVAGGPRHLSEQLNSTHLTSFGITLERTITGNHRLIHLTRTTPTSVKKARTKGTNTVQ